MRGPMRVKLTYRSLHGVAPKTALVLRINATANIEKIAMQRKGGTKHSHSTRHTPISWLCNRLRLKRGPRQNISVTELTTGTRARMECPIQADHMARVVLPEGVPGGVLVV